MGTHHSAKFTQELFDEICLEIAYSDKGLVSICKKHNINASSFYDWIAKDTSLHNKYARARELQAEFLAEQIVNLIDEEPAKTTNKAGAEVIDSAWVTNQNNRVHTRKWLMSKLLPKKYGERIQQDISTDGPVQIKVIRE